MLLVDWKKVGPKVHKGTLADSAFFDARITRMYHPNRWYWNVTVHNRANNGQLVRAHGVIPIPRLSGYAQDSARALRQAKQAVDNWVRIGVADDSD